MKVSYILENYLPGGMQLPDVPGAWNWADEFAQLWHLETGYMVKLTVDVRDRGILRPIRLGYDGRLWDGHHRLAVACALVLDDIPALLSTDPEWDNLPGKDGDPW